MSKRSSFQPAASDAATRVYTSLMTPRLFRFVALLGLSLLVGSAGHAAAQPEKQRESPSLSAANGGIQISKVRIGFDGKYKSGYWTPVWLTLSGSNTSDSSSLQLNTFSSDGDNVPVVYPAEGNASLTLNDKSPAELRYVRMGPIRGRVGVELRSGEGNQVVWSESLRDLVPPPLAATQELLVTIGPDVGVEAALKLTRRSEGLAAASAQVESAAELPDRWWGYEGVDWIFLSTRDQELLDGITPAQFEALHQWVLMGGRLVMSVGSRGEELLSEESRWNVFAPGTLAEVRPLRDRAGLESFTNTELPWDDEDFQRSRPLISELKKPEGRVEFDEGGVAQGQPLASRRALGFGHVLFLSFDLDDPQLAAWPGRPRLVSNLLQRWQGSVEDTTRQSRQAVQHLGFEDLSGQMRAALEQFPGITVVNVATVAVLTLVYLLLIGPADFFLFRRTGLPAYGAWITFPLIVLGFAGAAWYMARSAHGDVLRLNQAEVIDIDMQSRVIRATTWHHLYSPSAAQFDLSLEVDAERIDAGRAPQGWLAWQGLPGSGLGGLGSQQVALAESPTYEVLPPGSQMEMENLPVPVASSKALAGRWWGRSDLEPIATLTTNEFGLPQGEVRNPFEFELDECLLAYDEWLFRLQSIPAGGSVSVEDFASLNLEARLTQRTVVDAKDITTPWEQDSVDVPRIMQIMLFHETARGRNYTGLTHEYLGHLDLTEHLRSGRAVLVGRAEKPVSQLKLSESTNDAEMGQQQHWSWIRFVLPVDTSGDRR